MRFRIFEYNGKTKVTFVSLRTIDTTKNSFVLAEEFLYIYFAYCMIDKKHIHCIGIGGIGISALARYYLAQGYRITGTNMGHSPLLDTLTAEGIEIVID